MLRTLSILAFLVLLQACVGEFPGRIVECAEDGYCKFLADDNETFVACSYSSTPDERPPIGTRGIAKTSRGYPIPFAYFVNCPQLAKKATRATE